MPARSRPAFALVTAALAAVPLLAGTGAAHAADRQPSTVSPVPVSWTPNVLDGTVNAIAVVGDEAVVGGDFTRVAQPGGDPVERHGLFAFQLGTGRISDTFAPDPDGAVNALAAGPGGTVYAGGDFGTVAGAEHRGLAQLAVSTGAPVPAFAAGVDRGGVTTLAARGGWLYAGGDFTTVGGTARSALARLSGSTGAVDAGFNAALAEPRDGPQRVQKLALSPDGSTLAVAGTFAQVGGAPRAQFALVSSATGGVSGWWTDAFAEDCHPGYRTYLRAVDFAPDGTYLVVVTSGHEAGETTPCDAAVRLNTFGTGSHPPVWVNRTGGNTLTAVAVTGPVIYVGGHQEWLDNPQGDKSPGPGAVERPGIGALDPATGHATGWNPTKDRGVGVQALVTYPGGLLVGSDTEHLAHAYHARLGAFPL